jgi:DNA-directed RNA polymerase subunit RPC12/RpoP
MFKNIIAPIQAWLLGKGQCVGCGNALSQGFEEKSKIKNHTKITCKKCGRIFMKNDKTKVYRRALFEEV